MRTLVLSVMATLRTMQEKTEDDRVLQALRFAVDQYNSIPEGELTDLQAQLLNEMTCWGTCLYKELENAKFEETGYLKDNIVEFKRREDEDPEG